MALAKMRRVFLVGLEDQKEKAVKSLQEMGVLHIEPAAKMAGEMEKRYNLIQQQVRKAGQICEWMDRLKKTEARKPVQVPDDQILSFCESRMIKIQELQNRKQNLRKLIAELSVWGDFDPGKIRDLEQEGVFVQRFRVEGKLAANFSLPEDLYAEVVSRKPALEFFTVRIGGPAQIPQAIPLRHPEMGLHEAQQELRRIQEDEANLIAECSGLSSRMDELRGLYNIALNAANYTEHLGTLYSDNHLFGLQGWIPANLEDRLLKQIESSGIPLMVTTRDPLDDETPPTLFRNNRFIRLTEPILELYGLPAYRSIDPSYFFAPFMILFFGICLGDAGYGIIFLFLATWLKKKWQHRGDSFIRSMNLCQAFSMSTIIIGLLTGSVFGYSFEYRNWILVDVDINAGNPMILFYISLGLGVLHLSFSYLLGMIGAGSRNDLLQKLGCMLVLWGGTCLIAQNIWFADQSSLLYITFSYAGYALLILGILLTFFSASDSRNWGIRIGLGFWNIYGLTGLIGDLLSYARLFGLGIATTAIATVMNQLAGMIHEATGPVMGSILAFILLLAGHSFNLAISVLGSTVHSARLHFVEAFKSFYQGGGVQYKPFKIERG